MLTSSQSEILTRRFRARTDRLALEASNGVVRAWDVLPDYEEIRIAQFSRRIGTLTTAAKRASVANGVGFYSTLAQVRTPSVAAAEIAVEFDVRAAFVAYWNALSNGRPWDDAVLAGRNRAESSAAELVVSSARRTGDHVLPNARWSRVPSGNACAWCVTVADDEFLSAETADFGHERCSCVVIPA